MEKIFEPYMSTLASGVEVAAALLIGIAALEATARALWSLVRPPEAREEIRLRLARWLVLALEFLLAADILRTVAAPTWEDIGKLATIIVLRTVLNYFLSKEIARAALTHREARARETERRSEGPTRGEPGYAPA